MKKIQAIAGNDTEMTLDVMEDTTVFIDNGSAPHSNDDKSTNISDHQNIHSDLTVLMSSNEGNEWGANTIKRYRASDSGVSAFGENVKTEFQQVAPLEKNMKQSNGRNDLLIGAMPMIHSVMALVSDNSDDDVDFESVRSKLMNDIDRFVNKSNQCVSDKLEVLAARYALCSFIDEILTTSEWGLAHRWGAESLLSYFHNETEGGNGFFTLLDRSLQQPHLHLDLLELMYVCLSLGFSGVYRLNIDGVVKLENQREILMTTISSHRRPDNSRLVVGEIKQKPAEKKCWRWAAYAALVMVMLSTAGTYMAASYSIDGQLEKISGGLD